MLVQERENASLKTCPPAPRTNVVQILGRGEDAARINTWIKKKTQLFKKRKERKSPPEVKWTSPSSCLSVLDNYKGAKAKITTTKNSQQRNL